MNAVRQLRNPYAERWDFLAGLLPHGINPTDIDLSIERNGHFLFMEGKRLEETMGKGQQRYFEALVKGPRSISVVRFWGKPPAEITHFAPWGQGTSETTTDEFRTYVRAWFDSADWRAV